MVKILNGSSLFIMVFWSSIGLGIFIYGKKKQSILSLLGGIAIMVLTYFISSGLVLSFLSLLIIGVIYFGI
ncbi:MAG: amino acid transport protein [bacterium]